MIQLLIITFITGILVKFVDTIEDEKLNSFKPFAYAAAIVYGILIGFVIVQFPSVSPLWVGIIIGVVLAKKIDTLPHLLGVVVAILIIAVKNIVDTIPKINYIILAVFTLASFCDEKIDLLLHKIKNKNIFQKLLEARLTVEIAALAVSAVTGMWILFFAILTFDIGYLSTEYLYKKLKK